MAGSGQNDVDEDNNVPETEVRKATKAYVKQAVSTAVNDHLRITVGKDAEHAGAVGVVGRAIDQAVREAVTAYIDEDVRNAVTAYIDQGEWRAARGGIEEAVRTAVDDNIKGALARDVIGDAKKNLEERVQQAVKATAVTEIERAVKKLTRSEIELSGAAREGEVIEYPYKEIENILVIEDDPFFKAALREWDRKEEYLAKRLDRREKSSADLVNQLFNIVGFFSVFQGVVLTAVSQLKSSTYKNFETCGIIYFPVMLSFFAGAFCIIALEIKYRNLKELENSIQTEKHSQKVAAGWATSLRGDGKKFFKAKPARGPDPPRSFFWKWAVYAGVIWITLLFIMSYFTILCGLFALPYHSYKLLEKGL